MTIQKEKEGNKVTFVIEGNIDTSTAPLLENELGFITEDVNEVVFDFTDVDYISSAGLRTMLLACGIVGNNGVVKVKGANDMVQDILHTTGFSEMMELI